MHDLVRPVVTAKEMVRLEELAIDLGVSEQQLMENAGTAIAERVALCQEKWGEPKKAFLLIGKGNKGGDAFTAGRLLLQMGWEVSAFTLYPKEECSPLCRKQWDRFSGAVHPFSSFVRARGIVLDGLVGTGFKGAAEGKLLEAIHEVNLAATSVVSIDLPSGLSVDTGEVGSEAIFARATISLGLPKRALFLNRGWEMVGEFFHADIGLPEEVIAKAIPSFYQLDPTEIRRFLPSISRTQNKYTAGYVTAFAGSFGMGGAALLASKAALRSGAGIVRLFHREGVEAELSSLWELVKEGFDLHDPSPIFAEQRRAGVLLAGPGIGRSPPVVDLVGQIISQSEIPLVLDADALYALGAHPEWTFATAAVLTPHRGELSHLLGASYEEDELLLAESQKYAQERGVTLIIKGAPTFVLHPAQLPVVIAAGDPGMATAGSGDVLSGILAALIARGLSPYIAALIGVYLHAKAGEIAACEKGSYSLLASDLIEALPSAFIRLA